jgi:hypothetical protein
MYYKYSYRDEYIANFADLSLYHCSTHHPYDTEIVEKGYESYLDNANLRYDPARRKLKCDTEWAIAQLNTSDLQENMLNTDDQIQRSYNRYLQTDEEILNDIEKPLPPRNATKGKGEALDAQELIEANAELHRLNIEKQQEIKTAKQNAVKEKKASTKLTKEQNKANERLAKQLADAQAELKMLKAIEPSTPVSLVPLKAAKTSKSSAIGKKKDG